MRVIMLAVLLLMGCDQSKKTISAEPQVEAYPVVDVGANLEFDCALEVIPEAHASVDELFNYARWRQKNNQLKRDVTVDLEVERLYRIAAEHGHAKANINLQNGSMRGRFRVRSHEHLRLSRDLIDNGVATGYYFVAIFLQRGAAGLEQDADMAFRYFYKAALEGSNSAQLHVGNKLASIESARETAAQMRRCAAEQGNGEAAVVSAIRLKNQRSYDSAVQIFQLGVKAGSSAAAKYLEHAFSNPAQTDELNFLSQTEDTERAERYKKIWRILANYSYANPKVPEIDEIVPLPPAKLPPWDGKLQWLEERLANIPPPKPDEWLIEKLAKEKGLDPATGRPMPGSPAFKTEYFPAVTCESNQPCPQEGYGKVMWPESRVQGLAVAQEIGEGTDAGQVGVAGMIAAQFVVRGLTAVEHNRIFNDVDLAAGTFKSGSSALKSARSVATQGRAHHASQPA